MSENGVGFTLFQIAKAASLGRMGIVAAIGQALPQELRDQQYAGAGYSPIAPKIPVTAILVALGLNPEKPPKTAQGLLGLVEHNLLLAAERPKPHTVASFLLTDPTASRPAPSRPGAFPNPLSKTRQHPPSITPLGLHS